MKKIFTFAFIVMAASLFASCTKECQCTIYSGNEEPYSYTMTTEGSCSDLNQISNGKANNNPTGSTSTKRVCTEL